MDLEVAGVEDIANELRNRGDNFLLIIEKKPTTGTSELNCSYSGSPSAAMGMCAWGSQFIYDLSKNMRKESNNE